MFSPGGETEEEIVRVDMLENQVMDFRMSLVMVVYNPDFVSSPASVVHSCCCIVGIYIGQGLSPQCLQMP